MSTKKISDINILGYYENIGIYKLVEDKNSPMTMEKFELVRGEESALRFSLISRHLRWLQGEILTILEATIDNDRKLKASKDLVKDKISAKISWVYEQCGCPDGEEESELGNESTD